MANISIATKAYEPISFDEMLKPLSIYAGVYAQREKELGDLESKGAVLSGKLNSKLDKRSYDQYNDYMNRVSNLASSLASQGLSGKDSLNFRNMTSTYNKDITKIIEGVNHRAELIKTQTAGEANGVVFEEDAHNLSVDDLVDNPTRDIRFADTKQGRDRISALLQGFAKKLLDTKKRGASIQVRQLDGYTNMLLTEFGYTQDQFERALLDVDKVLSGNIDSASSQNLLVKALEMDLKASGVDKWTNMDAKRRYIEGVKPAFGSILGETKTSTFENYGARIAAQRAASGGGGGDDKPSLLQWNAVSTLPVGIPGVYDKRINKFMSKYLTPNKKIASTVEIPVSYAAPKQTSFISGKDAPKTIGLHKGGPKLNVRISLYGNKGIMYTKHQFMTNAFKNELKNIKDPKEINRLKGILSSTYDAVVQDFNSIGIDTERLKRQGKSITKNGVAKAYNKAIQDNSPALMRLPIIPLQNHKNTFNDKVLSLAGNNIYKISDYNAITGEITKGEKVSMGVIGDNEVAPVLMRSMDRTKPGIIIKKDEDLYYVPASALGSQFEESATLDYNQWLEGMEAQDLWFNEGKIINSSGEAVIPTTPEGIPANLLNEKQKLYYWNNDHELQKIAMAIEIAGGTSLRGSASALQDYQDPYGTPSAQKP